MGKGKRLRPARLGEKLSVIRHSFDYSLTQMAERLSSGEATVSRQAVSHYELNNNEPPLPVLLKYARLAGITIDVLADDEIELSEYFPHKRKIEN